MAISRGIVRHRITENISDFFQSIIHPKLLDGASISTQAPLKEAVQRIFDGKHVSLFPFARTALHAILTSMKLPGQSKILMTPVTIGPMVEVIEALGHEVVFVDIETNTFGPCLTDLERKVQAGAACFLMTHLFGYVSQIDQAVKICREAGVFVIEDISHNLGADLGGLALGLWGDAAIYSASLLKYVDGYNGAFSITNNQQWAIELDRQSDILVEPDKKRVRSVISKTLIWNIALSRWPFNFVTWPALKALRAFDRNRFESLVGPGIPFVRSKKLPSFYFEKITTLQCRAMLRNIQNLSSRLESRRKMAAKLTQAIAIVCTDELNRFVAATGNTSVNTYWQFVVPVRSTSAARDFLFNMGIETNTTNLRDLAFEDHIILPGARALKERFIFIPLHDHLKVSDYQKIMKDLSDFEQREA